MTPVKVRDVIIGEGKPKICVPIVGTTEEAILAEAASFVEQRLPLDVVEWRADWYEGVFTSRGEDSAENIFATRTVLNTERVTAEEKAPEAGAEMSVRTAEDIACLLKTAFRLREVLGEIPLLFTFRTAKEGGQKPIATEDYVSLNTAMAISGFVDMIDVELFTGDEPVERLIRQAHEAQVKVIASNHDFFETPGADVLLGRLRKMQQLGADILKIAVMPRSRSDVLTLLQVTLEMREKYAERPIVTMSMGTLGVISRLAGETFGSSMSFGAASQASAPGQVSVGELDHILDFLHRNLS